MPPANNIVRACDVIMQRHFCNVILIRRIILISRFGQNHIAVLAESNNEGEVNSKVNHTDMILSGMLAWT